MTAPRTPPALDEGGRRLWRSVVKAHELSPAERVILLEACRTKDRLDRIADGATLELAPGISIRWDDCEAQQNRTADSLKQLIAALRLPDSGGRRPQRRGTRRGAYRPKGARR